VSSTERVSFGSGGIIRLNDSYGYVSVEGWDRPEVEITVIKSTQRYYKPDQQEQAVRRLERLRVVAERRSDSELTISTLLPLRSGRFSPPLPPQTKAGVTVHYEIRAPRDSRLVIHHGGGYLSIGNMRGDMEVTSRSGDIMLMLPGPGPYSIDAKSTIGTVSLNSARAAHNLYLVGERIAHVNPPPAHQVYLRMGFGGITINEPSPHPY
jgi:hypothetical protein